MEETKKLKKLKKAQDNIYHLFEEYFSKECLLIYLGYKAMYISNSTEEVVRKSMEMSLMGIIWTQTLNLIKRKASRINVQPVFNIRDEPDAWSQIEKKVQDEIIYWIGKHDESMFVKQEALIYDQIWIILFRRIILAMEDRCLIHKNRRVEMKCFGEFNTSNLKTIGRRFYTDLVYLAGSSGLPLMMMEIEVSEHAGFIHKDLKKLAVQLSGVLLYLIGAIRKSGKAGSIAFIPNLRVLGGLIFNTEIQMCISRPQLTPDGKFVIIFETQEDWKFELFNCDEMTESFPSSIASESTSDIDIVLKQCIEITEPHEVDAKDVECILSTLDIDIAKKVESENSDDSDDSDDSDEYESYEEEDEFSESDFEIRQTTRDSIASITKFIAFIHQYYESLPQSIADIYRRRPGKPDTRLLYRAATHDLLHTSAGVSPKSQQARLLEVIQNTSFFQKKIKK